MSNVNPMLEDNDDEDDSVVVNPLLSDDVDDAEDSFLPNFDEDDFLTILDDAVDSSVSDDRQLVDSEDTSYPVNYDDYVQMDIDRGVRSPNDSDKSFDDSFNSVLNPVDENYDNDLNDMYGSGTYDFDATVNDTGNVENENSGSDKSVVEEVSDDIDSGDFVYEPDDFSSSLDNDPRSALLSMYENMNEDSGDSSTPVYSTSSDSYDNDDYSTVDVDDDFQRSDDDVDTDYDGSMSTTDVLLQIQQNLESGDDDEEESDYPKSGSMFYQDDDEGDAVGAHQLDIDAIISLAIDMNASDIDLIPNDEVTYTILGEVRRIPQFGILTSRQISNTYRDITTSVSQEEFLKFPDMDTSYEVRRGKHMGRRLRLSVGKTFDSHFMVFRVISNVIPSPSDINMDPRLLNWSTLPNGLVLINGPTGVGKALAYNTPVPTPHGLTTMGELKVGDIVYDSRMQPCTIEWISDVNETPELYRVSFSDGQTIIADADHQWIVSSKYNRDRIYTTDGFNDDNNIDNSLVTLKTRDMLNEGVFVNGSECNFAVPFIRHINNDSTKIDETVNKTTTVETNFENLIDTNDNENIDMYKYGFNFDDSNALNNDNTEDNKVVKEIPYEFLTLPYNQRLDLLRGLMDSSGFVGESNKTCELSLSNNVSVNSVLSLVRSLGIRASLSKDVNNTIVFVTDKLVFTLESELSKLPQFDEIGDLGKWNHIVSIVPVLPGDSDYVPALCIGVDSPDHSYLCADYVVTHNSTTLASIMREIQVKRRDKIITIEKPVEYVYGIAGGSSVTQREVGKDTISFSAGLDGAMRQHPDVILIGEVRNQEEVNAVLYAAETGHLAFSTMHTNSASHTLNRIKRLFKGEEQVRILGDLSEVVRGLSNQVLVLSPDGNSRSSVNEVLEVDETVKDLILNGDVRGISRYQEETGTTMEHELVKAVKANRCTIDEARRVTSFRPRLDKILKDEGLI